MASIGFLIGGALVNALAFTGSNYMFSSLSKESIDKERKRHDKAIEDMQQAQLLWAKKRQERLDYINDQIIKEHKAEKRFVDLSSAMQEYTYLQNKRMRRCGVPPPPPPPIIFERLKLPQQIVYRRKENLSESPNHQKYWENILVSRFYEQFSRNRRNLGHFRKFEKISNS